MTYKLVVEVVLQDTNVVKLRVVAIVVAQEEVVTIVVAQEEMVATAIMQEEVVTTIAGQEEAIEMFVLHATIQDTKCSIVLSSYKSCTNQN